MHNKVKTRKSKGFTLIEVMVVIFIIIILASLFVPKVTGYIEKGGMAKQLSYAKSVATAVDNFNMWQGIDEQIGETAVISGLTDTQKTELAKYIEVPTAKEKEEYDVYTKWTVKQMRDYCKSKIYPTEGMYAPKTSTASNQDDNTQGD